MAVQFHDVVALRFGRRVLLLLWLRRSTASGALSASTAASDAAECKETGDNGDARYAADDDAGNGAARERG